MTPGGSPIFEKPLPDHNPSIPPNVTWPMVAYRLVKDMPLNLPIVGGIAIALILIERIPGQLWAPIVSTVAPMVLAHAYRSRPAEDR